MRLVNNIPIVELQNKLVVVILVPLKQRNTISDKAILELHCAIWYCILHLNGTVTLE